MVTSNNQTFFQEWKDHNILPLKLSLICHFKLWKPTRNDLSLSIFYHYALGVNTWISLSFLNLFTRVCQTWNNLCTKMGKINLIVQIKYLLHCHCLSALQLTYKIEDFWTWKFNFISNFMTILCLLCWALLFLHNMCTQNPKVKYYTDVASLDYWHQCNYVTHSIIKKLLIISQQSHVHEIAQIK